ncbi:23S rRNA (adenine(2030)-N(6))-methyltransferase RlmJ [Asticcacaulis sp. 201]|uniref:23S rRNA (adenine(2030)-N(6))-methyltransferase RlmJ n=1 Tax=Asticcacaulis sp. 201 TaxID=3028787 RepID=UPI00291681AB|nr:23S rRNA (adenine(2030)-N(6))-methyltransferase RlmJ [Asticcacaulis sp. 201]MDV6333097.1 23S rRNA (adenine(2030)-N(6))-methyltransferase RlmJ [Asticcacaulis sp. 201]
MNYRHGFHAGNFADLAKHAAVLTLLRLLRDGDQRQMVIDTHAGAGFYDLSNPDFARSREAEAGIKYLMSRDVPDSLKPLADYVRAKNAKAGFRDRIGIYPGSPVLILDHQRPNDQYVGCELRDDDYRLLYDRIEPRGQAIKADGYKIALQVMDTPNALLYLIDPPFEKADDYARITSTLRDVLTLRPDARALIWLPLKDLETFDAWLRHMEREIGEMTEILVAELRLRPLWNPMTMNGCALVAVNAPEAFTPLLTAISEDVVRTFGEEGAVAKVRIL